MRLIYSPPVRGPLSKRPESCQFRAQEHKEDANMRAIIIAMLAGAGIGFFGPSGASAAPANGAVIGQDEDTSQLIKKTRRYRRDPHRHRVPYYSYRSFEPSGTGTSHQLSHENRQRAQQNGAGGTGAGGGGGM